VSQGVDGWRASLLIHRPVVHAERLEYIGDVADIVFDPHTCQLMGLLVKPEGPEGTVLEMVRRAFGGNLGLTFVPRERLIALNGDVVMVSAERTRPTRPARSEHLPQLRTVLGFDVVNMRGQRLGALADLLLDREGRRLIGYLVDPTRHATTPGTTREQKLTPAAGTSAPASHEMGEKSSASSSAPLLMLPAAPHVQIGRDLIFVAEDGTSNIQGTATPISRPISNAPAGSPNALVPSIPDQPTEEKRAADIPTDPTRPADAPGDPMPASEAPTDQIRLPNTPADQKRPSRRTSRSDASLRRTSQPDAPPDTPTDQTHP